MKKFVNFLRKPFKNKVGLSGDNQDIEATGKGISWAGTGVIVIIICLGLLFGYNVYKKGFTTVKTEITKFLNIGTGAGGEVDTSI